MELPAEALAAYVPRYLVRRAAADPSRFRSHHGERLPAVVLFADLVGFTPLASELARRGPEGAERLTSVLNTCFGPLADCVDEHGGDILKFPGDAALAFWPARSQDELIRAAGLAGQCGLGLNRIFRHDGTETSGLRLRVGIGAGTILFASVGGSDGRWECVAGGEPLDQLARAQEAARPGDVVLAPQAWSLIEAHARGEALAGGCFRLDALLDPFTLPGPDRTPAPPRLAATLRRYVPKPVLSRLDAGQKDWLAELRRISVLFLSVRGIDYLADGALDRLQALTGAMQSAIQRYEGGLNQFVVDDKGTVVLATWGVSLSTHEDDAARAVRAALAMQADLAGLGLSGGIGLTTGRAFCGRRGGARRSEYAVIGDVVNLAARLMLAAGSGVLCDQETCLAARAQVEFATLPPIAVKGVPGAVVVHQPLGERRVAAPSTAWMVGREREQSRLVDRLEALRRDGRGGVLVIEGEAGIGKSRLVADLLHRARAGRADRAPRSGEPGDEDSGGGG